MVVNPRPISFDGARSVKLWLDGWAAERLEAPDDWRQALDLTRDWSDYSSRNQLLLASYGATGPVAGIETWHLVPSRGGGVCEVRSGEHALPVRVPVTAVATEPDPHLGGVRPTQAAVAGWEWRGVFALGQLARRPDHDALARPVGSWSEEQVHQATVAAARRTLRGRLPTDADPIGMLEAAAARMPRGSSRPAPTGVLAEQVAQLALDRVGRAGALAEFDPGPLRPRERWETMLDVVDVERRLSSAISHSLGVDLLASPLPRMVVDDDRVVAAHRRNRLPRASVAQLPLGQWVDVGPYTAEEWAARGESANGKGAYLRLNSTAYVVAVEHGERASWRLEDTRTRVGAGRLDGADAPDLPTAMTSAARTLGRRYPQLTTTSSLSENPPPPPGWTPVEDQPGAWQHSHHGDVTSWVLPAGGQWIPLVARTPGAMAQAAGPPAATRGEAMDIAARAARRAVRKAALESRVDFDAELAGFASSVHYDREGLIDRLAPRLAPPEHATLAATASPMELVEVLGAAGVTSATTLVVLHAENVPPNAVAPLLPLLGIDATEGIRELHQRWGLARVEAAELLGATAAEMRAAGCGPREILVARPRDALPTLPAVPDLWDLAGGTLAGRHGPEEVVGLLASHAPDPDCFAAGLAAAIDDPTVGLSMAARRGMPPAAVAACSERYGLSPADTATALAAEGASANLAIGVVLVRCDEDPVLTTQIARSHLGLRTDTVLNELTSQLTDADTVDLREQLHSVPSLSNDRHALLAAHRTPDASVYARSSAAPMVHEPRSDTVAAPELPITQQELM